MRVIPADKLTNGSITRSQEKSDAARTKSYPLIKRKIGLNERLKLILIRSIVLSSLAYASIASSSQQSRQAKPSEGRKVST